MSKIPRFRPNVSLLSAISILQKTFFTSLNNCDQRHVRPFEDAFAAYIGVRHAISVPSGRMGLYLILKHLELEAPGEIILPAYTYWAIPGILSYLKFDPVFVDIDFKTCNIDADQISRHVTRRCKAILPTHLYGLPCCMDKVLAVAKKYGLAVIEDCVQACGARYGGGRVGSFGEAAYFAFGITKNVSLLGGGMITTNSDALAEKIRIEISSFGFVNKKQICKKAATAFVLALASHPRVFPFLSFPLIYASSFMGLDSAGEAFREKETQFDQIPKSYFKLMPPVFQAEMGLQQLGCLDSLNEKRTRNAGYLLTNLKNIKKIILPELPNDTFRNIFTNFPIRSRDRKMLAGELLKKGIDTSFGYMKAHHAGCANAIALERQILHLPIYPFLSEDDLRYICQALMEISQKAYA